MGQYVALWLGNDGTLGRTILAGNWTQAVEAAALIAVENGESPSDEEIEFLSENGRIPFEDGNAVHIGGLEDPDVLLDATQFAPFVILGPGGWWSNSDGWGDYHTADRFSGTEVAEFTLPLDGIWVPEGTIGAETHSDDHRANVRFNATSWFTQASDEEIYQVARSGWGQDIPTNRIAQWFADINENVAKIFAYIELAGGGFECTVYADSAMAWLRLNRSELAKRIEEDEDIDSEIY